MIKNVVYLLLSFILLSMLGACTTEESQNENKQTVLAIPAPLQKLTTNGGVLSAYVLIDGDNTRIPMLIDAEGNGTASVVLPNLTRDVHSVIITYEYTDDVGQIILAQVERVVDLSSGSANLNIDANNYNLDFDEDGDGITNTRELVEGTDPRFIDSTASLRIDAELPFLSAESLDRGKIAVFVSIDDSEDRIVMDINNETSFASVTIRNLANALHNYLVEFEYVDSNGIFTVATLKREIDLLNQSERVLLRIDDFDRVQYDEDRDGLSNAKELSIGSDPRNATKPFSPSKVSLSYEPIKTFKFTWSDSVEATYYQVLENVDGQSSFSLISGKIQKEIQFFEHYVPLYSRLNARYVLRNCNDLGCTDSDSVFVKEPLIKSIGCVKASSQFQSGFGSNISLSDDGNLLFVATRNGVNEFIRADSGWVQKNIIDISRTRLATNPIVLSGDGATLAVVTNTFDVNIYVRNGDNWLLQDNIDVNEIDPISIDLSDDGDVLAIGAKGDSSNAIGINGSDTGVIVGSGAAYVYRRSGGVWSQQAFIKTNFPDTNDNFGEFVSLSGDGLTLAVGAIREDSASSGVNGLLESDNSVVGSGAAYIFVFNALNGWEQQAYIKSDNPVSSDSFGGSVALNKNGTVLALRSRDAANSLFTYGAVYVFERGSDRIWSQQLIIREPRTGGLENGRADLRFGKSINLNSAGDLLAIGHTNDKSSLIGLNSSVISGEVSALTSGAVFLYAKNTDTWVKRAFIKAPRSRPGDAFGQSISLSGDGATLATGASGSNSDPLCINYDPINRLLDDLGTVYLY